MRALIVPALWLAAVGCETADSNEECQESDQIEAYADNDGDGYGAGDALSVCALSEGVVDNATDCDDSNPLVFPDAEELCNAVDDDCNGVVDNGFELRNYYPDADGDGFGAAFPAVLSCSGAPEGHVDNDLDCDDEAVLVNPDAIEVCNDGIDDDCDNVADDADDSVDPESQTEWYEDRDADGLGNLQSPLSACEQPAGYVALFTDCDDRTDTITCFPDFFEDADLDGFGAEFTQVCSCEGYPGASDNDLDCDDNDPIVNIDKDWYTDFDRDGFGTGDSQSFGCFPPNGISVSPVLGDCNDLDPSISPGAEEICGDEIDQTCSGVDLSCSPESCRHIHDADPKLPTGIYEIFPDGASDVDLYCDMDTDGGGWTLVASTAVTTLNDEASDYYSDLTTLFPSAHTGVYDGLRPVVDGNSDIRFTCKINQTDSDMDVDLSFYDVDYYTTITTGTDAESCFNVGGVTNFPERRNNLTGEVLAEGNAYSAGVFEGEDVCTDTL